jgi:hypothetical protein
VRMTRIARSACFDAGLDPYTFEFMGVVGVACPDHLGVWGVATNTRSDVASEHAMATNDTGTGTADAADHRRHQVHKQHKAHASTHGHKHRR